MSKKLETALEECGCEMDAKMFKELVTERHATMHRSWTEDDLVCHPQEASQFCDVIRREIGANIPDDVILRTLLNARKAG